MPWLVSGSMVTVQVTTKSERRQHGLQYAAPSAHRLPHDVAGALALRGVEPGAPGGAAERGSEKFRGRGSVVVRPASGRVGAVRARRSRGPGVAGIRSGMRSRGGIGEPPRDDDDASGTVLDQRRGLRICRRRAADHAAEEPARAVDADESRHPGLAGAPCGAARPGSRRAAPDRTAPSRSSTRPPCWRICSRDLLADLVPQPARARCGERLHLQRRVRRSPGRRRRRACVSSSTSRRRLQPLARQDLDAAEVDVGTDGIRLALVERALRRAVLRAPTSGASGAVVRARLSVRALRGSLSLVGDSAVTV